MDINPEEVRNDLIFRLGDVADKVLKNAGSFDVVSTPKLRELLEAKEAGWHHEVVPKALKFNTDGGTNAGVAVIFRTHYNSIIKDDMEEIVGKFDINGITINCDIEVIKVLKALIRTGVTFDERIEKACSILSYGIIAILNPKTTYLTKSDVLQKITELVKDKSLKDDADVKYFIDVLYKCIKECLEC